MPAGWAEHQVRATVDFAPSSTALTWYLGGLNFQIEHHLFPGICHVHYPALAAVVEKTCREHEIPYRVQRTFWEAMAAHERHLRALGRAPAAIEGIVFRPDPQARPAGSGRRVPRHIPTGPRVEPCCPLPLPSMWRMLGGARRCKTREKVAPSPCSLIVLGALGLVLPCAARAQAVPVSTPKNIILPNYDHVFIGPMEALEAGAYLARTSDATASFYNPAGLAAAARTTFSASANGAFWTRLTSRSLGQSTSSSQFASTPGHFAVVVGPPLIHSDRLRLGFSLTTAVSWTPASSDQATPASAGTIPVLTHSSRVDFSTTMPAASLGYRVSRTLRLGVSTGVAYTSYSDEETISGELAASGEPSHFLSTLRASGSIYHFVASAGAQWDVTSQLKVGALLRAPGLRLLSRSLFTYESAVERSGGAASAYFRDDSGAFLYKLPLEVSAGVAYRFGPAEAEINVRYHQSAGQYTMYRSTRPLIVRAQNPDGTTTTSTEPFPEIQYSTRHIVNVATGGNYRVGRLTLHGGFFVSFSPIGDPEISPFQKADLYGGTLGAAVTGERWSGSLGFAYQYGSSSAVPGIAAGSVAELEWRSLTLLYALAYRF